MMKQGLEFGVQFSVLRWVVAAPQLCIVAALWGIPASNYEVLSSEG